jgi:hypothetical protein
LITAIDPEILFKSLVHPFSWPITFRMITQCEMQSHIKGFPERSEEMGDELGTMIRCNMGWDSVFGKDMEYEQHCRLRGSDRIVCRNEYGLLCKSVYNNKNGCVT